MLRTFPVRAVPVRAVSERVWSARSLRGRGGEAKYLYLLLNADSIDSSRVVAAKPVE
jgi:hypothetical protein